MRITVHNRGPEAATLHLLPQLWFRNTWSWDGRRRQAGADARSAGHGRGRASGARDVSVSTSTAAPELCSARTRPTRARLRRGRRRRATSRTPSTTTWSAATATRSTRTRRGTKAAAHYAFQVPAGGHVTVRTRLQAAPARRAASTISTPSSTACAPRPTSSTHVLQTGSPTPTRGSSSARPSPA